MRIINIIQDFNTGGRQKLLLEYLRYFKNNKDIDYRVVVLEEKYNSIFDEACIKEHLPITYLNASLSKNKHYYIRKIINWYKYDYSLYRHLKKEKPDIINTHNTRILIRIKWCIKKLYSKYKWFHSMCSDPFAVHEIHIPVAKKILNSYHVKPICINETQFLKAKERYGITSCIYLPNSFDFNTIKKNNKNRNMFRKELGINSNQLLIGCVGRVAPVKNYPFFIDVFNEIVKMQPSSIAIIVGDNSDDKEVRDKIEQYSLQDNVIFLGNRNDVGSIYKGIDRFVSTSFTEAFSFATIEAQVFDTTCIVSTAIPKESICLPNKVVRLSLDEPLSEWANQIINPSRFEKQYCTLEDYSIENVSKKMIEIYKNN